MNKKIHTFTFKTIFSFLFLLMCSFIVCIPAHAALPSISSSRYIRTYPLSTSNNTYIYTSSNLRTRGTSSPYKAYNAVIYASDEIYVYSMNSTYAYVSYPTSSGRKYGYIKTSSITSNNSSKNACTSRAAITTYRRAGSTSYGSISKGDTVYGVAVSGNYTQVVYPVGNQYKMGWITTSNYNNYIKPVSSSNTTSSSWQWPVSNYCVCGNGWSQYYSVKGKDHLGMDIKSSTGNTSIYAAASGTVASTGWNSANGNTISIKHTVNGKTVYSFYAHLSSINVSKGQSVSKGQKIGVIGNTGNSSTGTHLHFAITTQCSTGTWGYGTTFNNSNNSANYQGYTYYNPAYVINYNRLP